tara:strand:- start:317 stop:565 length:249 start_codon:yes stop_codon:yes gene_type:complete
MKIKKDDMVTLFFFIEGNAFPVQAVYTGKAVTVKDETYYQFTRHCPSKPDKHGNTYTLGLSILPAMIGNAWEDVDVIELPEV